MKTCPYCGSEVVLTMERTYYCDVCVMTGINPTENGNRKSKYRVKTFIDHDDIKKTTPELMLYHTLDLLQLLKLLRDERRSYFKHITTFKKAGNETEQFREIEKETGDVYEQITRKVWIVENILKDRIGYIPRKVTDQLLATVISRMEDDNNSKPMTIKKGCHQPVK